MPRESDFKRRRRYAEIPRAENAMTSLLHRHCLYNPTVLFIRSNNRPTGTSSARLITLKMIRFSHHANEDRDILSHFVEISVIPKEDVRKILQRGHAR